MPKQFSVANVRIFRIFPVRGVLFTLTGRGGEPGSSRRPCCLQLTHRLTRTRGCGCPSKSVARPRHEKASRGKGWVRRARLHALELPQNKQLLQGVHRHAGRIGDARYTRRSALMLSWTVHAPLRTRQSELPRSRTSCCPHATLASAPYCRPGTLALLAPRWCVCRPAGRRVEHSAPLVVDSSWGRDTRRRWAGGQAGAAGGAGGEEEDEGQR